LPQFLPPNLFVITNHQTLCHKVGNRVAQVRLKAVNLPVIVSVIKAQTRATSLRWQIAHVLVFAWPLAKTWMMHFVDVRSLHFVVHRCLVARRQFTT
jgi:hypothetical protein